MMKKLSKCYLKTLKVLLFYDIANFLMGRSEGIQLPLLKILDIMKKKKKKRL